MALLKVYQGHQEGIRLYLSRTETCATDGRDEWFREGTNDGVRG